MTGRRFQVHADDLSGAAEAAAQLLLVAADPVPLRLGTSQGMAALEVLDLDTRHLTPAAAEARVRAALERAGDALVATKIDSLLRGNVAAHLRALLPGPVVLAPALPSAGRTVVEGVVLVDGVPLADSLYSETWARDGVVPPAAVEDALGGLPVRHVDLDSLRAGRAGKLVAAGAVAVCDAVTDDDLDLLVGATWDLPEIRYVGAGGLAGAIARRLGTAPAVVAGAAGGTGGVLFVAGTTEAAAEWQVRELLARTGVECVQVLSTALDPVRGYADRVAAGLHRHGVVVLRAEAGATVAVPAVAATLAAITARIPATPDLVLTGGQTARAVLDALGVHELAVIDEIHHGAVRSRTPDGRVVVTRPGSFGSPSSFVDILDALRPNTHSAAHPAAAHSRKATTS